MVWLVIDDEAKACARKVVKGRIVDPERLVLEVVIVIKIPPSQSIRGYL